MTFRSEEPGETAVVRDVVARSFGQHVVADLVDALRGSTDWIDGLSFVAEGEGEIIGHLLFTRSVLDAPASWSTCWCSARSRCCPSIRARGWARR